MYWFNPEQLRVDLSSVENGTVSSLRAELSECGFLGQLEGAKESAPEGRRYGTDGAAIYEVIPGGLRLVVMGASLNRYSVHPDCVEIGRNAFAGLSALEAVDLPASLMTVGAFAFARTGLREVNLPEAMGDIQEKAFFHCVHLTRVTLNDQLQVLESGAFAQCPLELFPVPASVKHLGRQVVTTGAMTVSSANPKYFIQSGLLYQRGETELDTEGVRLVEAVDPALETCRVLEGTVEVGDEAFYHHRCVREVTLPDSVQLIGVQAFRGCRRLETVHLPENLRVIKAKAFANTQLNRLTIPAGLRTLGLNALLTQGDERLCPPPYLTDLTVEEGNLSFYRESGLLCERGSADAMSHENGYSAYADAASIAPMSYFGGTNEDRSAVLAAAKGEELAENRQTIVQATQELAGSGGDTLIQYCGENESVRIPPQVEAIAPYAFAGVRSIRELYLHPRIRNVGLCAFALSGAIPLVHLELEQPVNGRTSIDLTFPDNDYGARALEYAFAGGMAGPVAFCSYWDDSIIRTEDPFERGRLILDRLHDPIFLDEDHRRQFYRILRVHVRSIAKSFASHNYVEGFDRLIDEGVLDEANITEVIDHLSGDEVAMTGYLLEIKRRRFGMNLDFSL